jgi:RNA recognition motif-containing protein
VAKKIFVGNLPYETNASDLLAWFQRNGFPAETVDLSVDRLSGHPRGFGFVKMNEQVAKQCVIACNGQDFLGRTLIVNEAASGHDVKLSSKVRV